jgi:hypothetical protein
MAVRASGYTPDMRYGVWGLHPANLIETFASESEALDEARGLMDAGWLAHDLSLGRLEGVGGVVVAEGDALARLARSADTGRELSSA